ncbi:384_t:CDS:2 [Entrophospora sp. SA101]|nr:384_t:CDS:2 [Entrophospora sp. SA101]
MGKKCLVALDGSKHSNNALVWTLENLIQLNDNNNDEDTLMLLSVGVLYNDNEISSAVLLKKKHKNGINTPNTPTASTVSTTLNVIKPILKRIYTD